MTGSVRAALSLLPRSRPAALPGGELVRPDVPVDRDHLAEYDRVCGFPLADTLPATYPHVLAFPLAMRLMSAADFPVPVVGLVHVANRITVHRPMSAATTMDFSVRAADLRPHTRGLQFDVVATATAAGEVLWTGVSTYLKKQSAGSEKRDPAALPEPSARWRIPARVGADYAAVSGDRNPIHTSRLGARLFGFPRPIAHGMWSAARCLGALTGRLPATLTVDTQFKLPILLPATVGFTAGRTDDGWEFLLHGRGPHVAGRVTSI